MFAHGGVSNTTGHGCISDLWALDLPTRAWRLISCTGDRQVISSKVAAYQVAPVAACGHAMAVTDDGAILLFGGLNREKQLVRALQAIVPIATNVPGGVPAGVAPDLFIRQAGLLVGLAHARCALAMTCTLCVTDTVTCHTFCCVHQCY